MKLLKGLLWAGIIMGIFALPELIANAIPAEIAWIFFDIFIVIIATAFGLLSAWVIRYWESK